MAEHPTSSDERFNQSPDGLLYGQGFMVPRYYFSGKGIGEADHALSAFDRALLEAGIGDVNLIKLSSILPPGCQKIAPFKIPSGSLVPVAYASVTCDRPNTMISAAVAIAFSKDSRLPGLIMEFAGYVDAKQAESHVKHMAEKNFEYRNRELLRIETFVVEHIVQNCGCAFAGVVLVP